MQQFYRISHFNSIRILNGDCACQKNEDENANNKKNIPFKSAIHVIVFVLMPWWWWAWWWCNLNMNSLHKSVFHPKKYACNTILRAVLETIDLARHSNPAEKIETNKQPMKTKPKKASYMKGREKNGAYAINCSIDLLFITHSIFVLWFDAMFTRQHKQNMLFARK